MTLVSARVDTVVSMGDRQGIWHLETPATDGGSGLANAPGKQRLKTGV